MSRPITFLAAAAAVLLVAVTAAMASPYTTTTQAATVKAAQSSLGKILVDSKGRTLYLFKKDSGKKSRCYGDCAANWPPLKVSGKPTAGGGARASKLGTTRRSDGTRQVTYNGHPLYRFAGDGAKGDTNGQGLNAFGARWYVVSPSGGALTGR
jgi:predicted lipoprotein with Yx(FWY)xxD motif